MPLSIDVQKAYGALGTAGGIGLVVSSTSDLGDLSAALKEERQKMPSAKVFIVTKSSDVISVRCLHPPTNRKGKDGTSVSELCSFCFSA